MLLKAGDVIFNSELIMKAEFHDGATPSLDVFLAGGGQNDTDYNALTFTGDDARAVWVALSAEASGIPGVKFKP